jgi:D-3-phosphoglycerate dehydrogenase
MTQTDFIIVVATELTQEAIDVLEQIEGITLRHVAPKEKAVREALADAHVLIAREELHIDAKLIEAAPQLRIIAHVSAALSNIDIEAATSRGIMVMNTPGASAIAAAEHALALMLASSRRLIPAHNSLREGYWLLDRKRQAGIQLFGKTVGLIGLGRVGMLVAQRCLAFGMTVLAYDPYIAEESVLERVQLAGLKEVLMRSDFVSLHVPLTRETEQMIGADEIQVMKKGARLINTSNGLLVDEDALAEALKSGHLGGIAIDTFREEPPYNSPLVGLDLVVHTPHISDNTVEATQDLSMRVVRQVIDALQDKDYRNVINMPLLPGINYDEMRPYLTLANRMGLLIHSLARAAVRRVAVEVRGDDMSSMIKPITVGVLRGLLTPILGEKVSTVNAPMLAHERGWQITQAKGLRAVDYSSVVNVRVTLDDGEDITITGTLLDHKDPYIVQINQYRMNFVPKGHLLLMGSVDKPGVIGRVGTMLSEHGVNIAGWYTGRAEPGGNTLTVLTLDEELPDYAYNALEQFDFIRHARRIWIG